VKVASISTGLCSGNDVGYLNVTLLKLIPLFKVYFYNGFGPFLTLGTRSITSNIKTPKVFAATIACTFGKAEIRHTKPVINAIIV
jgi:hypothetical protein